MMLAMGFAQRWVDWIMLCVSTVKYSVLVNDRVAGPIRPQRGLRQGCPLSPYLFILCSQGLSFLIENASRQEVLHGAKICRSSPVISHLLFANDSFFFFKASVAECEQMKIILNSFESASDQSINFDKSGAYFSRNVSTALRESLTDILGVSHPLNTRRYLGLPSLIGRKK